MGPISVDAEFKQRAAIQIIGWQKALFNAGGKVKKDEEKQLVKALIFVLQSQTSIEFKLSEVLSGIQNRKDNVLALKAVGFLVEALKDPRLKGKEMTLVFDLALNKDELKLLRKHVDSISSSGIAGLTLELPNKEQNLFEDSKKKLMNQGSSFSLNGVTLAEKAAPTETSRLLSSVSI